jgi:DNA gyrase inhibitor GyrI
VMSWKAWALGGAALAVAGAGAATAQYGDIEQPAYAAVIEDGPFEMRDYAPMVVAQVTHSGSRESASGASFRRLAAYIFAQDRPAGGEAIAMTSPVYQQPVAAIDVIAMTAPVFQQESSAGEWRMRFVMPAKYTLATLPPAPDDIALTEVPARRLAVVTFNGAGRASDLRQMEAMLSDWLRERSLTPRGPFEYAFYDAPMVPPSACRNEVLVEVVRD